MFDMQKIYHDIGKAILFKDTETRDLLERVCEAAMPPEVKTWPELDQLAFRLDPDDVEKAFRAEIRRLLESPTDDESVRDREIETLSAYLK